MTSATPPDGPAWTFDYADGVKVTTPSGGVVQYRFEGHTFARLQPPRQGDPAQRLEIVTTVTKYRDVSDPSGGGPSGRWTYEYENVDESTSRERTTIVGPDGRREEFYHRPVGQAYSWENVVSDYALEDRILRGANGQELETEHRDYEPQFPVGDDGYGAAGYAMALKKRTIVRGGRSFVTEHTFNDSSQRFADYHRPWRTVETGESGQTRETEHDFDYAFDANRWFKDKISETRVRTNGEWFVVSRAFNDSSGFVDSETRYGITTTFEADPAGTGNVCAATDPHGHRTAFSYQWGR